MILYFMLSKKQVLQIHQTKMYLDKIKNAHVLVCIFNKNIWQIGIKSQIQEITPAIFAIQVGNS